MAEGTIYAVADTLDQLCRMLELDRQKVLDLGGVSADRLQTSGGRVTEEEFFALWDALMEVAGIAELPVELARSFAHGPFTPSLLAFSCSKDVRSGLERLAVFKPLMGPLRYVLRDTADGLELTLLPMRRLENMPMSLAIFELVFIIECCRVCTTRPIAPVLFGVPEAHPALPAASAYFGLAPRQQQRPGLLLARADAERELISENPKIWDTFGPGLRRQLTAFQPDITATTRVRNLLVELLPGGEPVSIEHVSTALKTSRRSLQRQLQAEGTGFQTLLQETRASLAEHYLADGSINLNEIAYLLGYGDPNSFFRSFRQWTGMTPGEARHRALSAAE